MKQIMLSALLMAAALFTKAQPLTTRLAGQWLTEDKTVVSFYQCRDAWCASQVDAAKAADKKYNGKVIAKNITAASGTELKGTVIDPDNGKEYTAKWTMSSDGKTLSIKVKWGLLSFSEKWVKQ